MTAPPLPESACPGCGWVAPESSGPTHPYIGASAACWARYGELLAERVGHLAVDTYAAQHPGVDERRAAQSVGVHLVSLCAALERGVPAARAPELIRLALRSRPKWPWLPLPQPVGTVTVDDVAGGRASVREWAEDVWAAWSPYHDVLRGWTDRVPDLAD